MAGERFRAAEADRELEDLERVEHTERLGLPPSISMEKVEPAPVHCAS